MKVIAYYRVSTKRQGDSGLGLEAQQAYIAQAATQMGWEVLDSFTDVESGSVSPLQRKACVEALAACKAQGATLVVAKLDRLSRDVADISALMKSVSFKVATMPEADSFQLHIYAALAEQERKFISQRTKEGLAALKARAEAGDSLSQEKIERRRVALTAQHTNKSYVKANEIKSAKADEKAKALRATVEAAIGFHSITTLQTLADYLNSSSVPTARGKTGAGAWGAEQVKRLLTRLEISFP